ncbi:hypothetical protein QWY28_17235 [Nocardioides sp. SOB77]|uniref:Uncharacterized protein n=1 Tax=Nocardioides oceani TaxID=3058369 RepID=A0ABT8FJ55_9ACTN|nr:hypothetical protein [Nocardioides oceani]MDN4174708.1 hypothetical protein [Nocardioides oceani]
MSELVGLLVAVAVGVGGTAVGWPIVTGQRPHRHRYEFHAYRHIRDADFGTVRTERYGTCTVCGRAKTKRVSGAWQPPGKPQGAG